MKYKIQLNDMDLIDGKLVEKLIKIQNESCPEMKYRLLFIDGCLKPDSNSDINILSQEINEEKKSKIADINEVLKITNQFNQIYEMYLVGDKDDNLLKNCHHQSNPHLMLELEIYDAPLVLIGSGNFQFLDLMQKNCTKKGFKLINGNT